jgi:hypothetical protein
LLYRFSLDFSVEALMHPRRVGFLQNAVNSFRKAERKRRLTHASGFSRHLHRAKAGFSMDGRRRSAYGSAVSFGRILVTVGIVGAAVAAAARKLASLRQRREVDRRSALVEAGIESFPASDPPSWTLGEDRTR